MKQKEKKVKTISVMLDVSRTSNYIDNKTAQIFIKQLEAIRVKFGADIGTISLSTSFDNPIDIRYILDTLARNLTENIIIGISFLPQSTYDYKNDVLTFQYFTFNSDKVATFDEYYISNPKYDNQWFALIDDSLCEDEYRQYRKKRPMFMCRPSREENKIDFMRYDTQTCNFDGVIEGLNYYIETIKDMTREEILKHQSNVLSCKDLKELIENGNFTFLKHLISEGHIGTVDCNLILEIFRRRYNFGKITKEELQELRYILDILYIYYEEKKNERGLLKVTNFKKITEEI